MTVKAHGCCVRGVRPRAALTLRRQLHGRRRGQSMVEFALILTVGLFVLLVSIQFALIGQAALAISQLAYQGARWASVNPNADQSAVAAFMKQAGSPTITRDGGTHLTITLTPNTTPRTFGDPLTVNITYDATPQIVLPNPFLGITFPSTLTSQQTAMSE